MTHTPTPWHYVQLGDDFYIIGKPEWPCRRNGVEQEWEICRMDDMVGEHQDEVKANAAYIVQCVNSHASLVEENNRLRAALEEIKSYSSMVRKSNILSSPFEDRTRRDIWVKARYEVGKKIYEMARSALGDTNA